jgi:hypothetical protein
MIAKLTMGITAAFAIIVGEAATTVANAEDQPITRTELLTADLAGIAGKEAYIYIADVKPAAGGQDIRIMGMSSFTSSRERWL